MREVDSAIMLSLEYWFPEKIIPRELVPKKIIPRDMAAQEDYP